MTNIIMDGSFQDKANALRALRKEVEYEKVAIISNIIQNMEPEKEYTVDELVELSDEPISAAMISANFNSLRCYSSNHRTHSRLRFMIGYDVIRRGGDIRIPHYSIACDETGRPIEGATVRVTYTNCPTFVRNRR